MIQEVKKYTDEDGRTVSAYIPRDTLADLCIKSRYEGVVGIQTPAGIHPIHFNFPEEYTLEECFEKFEATADEEIKKMKEKAEDENRIITPNSPNPSQKPIQFPKP